LHPWAEMRFKVALFTVSFVGIGTIVFHGTLSKFGQIMDELPMLYTLFTYLYTLLCQKYNLSNNKKYLLFGTLLIWACFVTFVEFFVDGNYTVFFISFLVPQLYLLYSLLESYWKYKSNHDEFAIKTFHRGQFFYGLGFSLWLIDRYFCHYVNPSYDTSFLHFNPQVFFC
jgi:hypothetical protein